MSERQPPNPDFVTEVLKFAIAAAGDMTDLAKWRGRLSVLIPEIVATIGEGSRERGQVEAMMNAPVLAGEFKGFTLHDGSHRCIVTFQANGRDEETFWSERTDTPHGAAQYRILQALPKGCQVLVWKGLRQIGPEKKVRDMLHIARLDADPQTSPPPQTEPVQSPSRPQEPPVPPQEATPAETSANGTAPAAETPTGTTEPVGERSLIPPPDHIEALDRLNGKQRVNVARWAKDNGIPNLYTTGLTAEQINSILVRCELEIAGMA